LSQGDTLVTQYEREFTKLSIFATHLICDEDIWLIKFCEGLHLKICFVVSIVKPSFYQEVLDLSLTVERNIQLVEETEIRKKRYKDLSTEEDEDGEGQGQNIEEREEKVNQELEVHNICHRFYRGECRYRRR
jgi:hypothetical protein